MRRNVIQGIQKTNLTVNSWNSIGLAISCDVLCAMCTLKKSGNSATDLFSAYTRVTNTSLDVFFDRQDNSSGSDMGAVAIVFGH